MMMTTSLMMLDGMLAVGRHEGTGSWSMTTRTRGVMVLLVMMVGRMMVAVRRRGIVLRRHVLRRGRAGSLAQMMLLGGHVGRSDGRDAVGGHRVLHLVVVAGPRREGRRGMGAAAHGGTTTLMLMMVVHAAMGRRRRRCEVPPRPAAGALVLALLELAHDGGGVVNNNLLVNKIGWAGVASDGRGIGR